MALVLIRLIPFGIIHLFVCIITTFHVRAKLISFRVFGYLVETLLILDGQSTKINFGFKLLDQSFNILVTFLVQGFIGRDFQVLC